MTIVLLIIAFIWIVLLQCKVSDLETSVKTMKMNFVENKNTDYQQKITAEEISNEEKAVDEFEQISDVAPVEEFSNDFEYFTKKEEFDWSKIFLGNIFNKIGAFAIILSIIIFIKLVSPYIIFTPLMKICAGFLAGLAMIFAAMFMHKNDKLKNYSEVLLGTGFADLFITAFCGYSIFNLYNAITAIVLGGIILISTFFIADKMKTLSMLVIGLIGGYLTPIVAGSQYILPYLIFLNLVSLVFTFKNPKYKSINIVNLSLTMIYMFVLNFNHTINIVYPIIFWAIYIIYDLFRGKNELSDKILTWTNYSILAVMTMIIFADANNALYLTFGLTALVYLFLTMFSRSSNNENYKTYDYYILLNIWFIILFLPKDIYSVISWAIVGLLTSVIVSRYKMEHLSALVYGYYFSSFTGVLLAKTDGVYYITKAYEPILNLRTLLFSVPIVSMFISSRLMKDKGYLSFGTISLCYIFAVCEINSIYGTMQDFNKYMIYVILGLIYALQTKKIYINTNFALFNVASLIIGGFSILSLLSNSYNYPQGYITIVNFRSLAYITLVSACVIFAKWEKLDIYKYLAVIFGFLLCHIESVGLTKMYGDEYQYVISLVWVLYSGIITTFGIIKNKDYLKYSGIVLSVLTIARIFMYDLAKVDMLYKLVICLALGIILMFVSYVYAKRK